MQKASDESQGFCAVGFQWSFSKAIQNLKKDILNGRWGTAKRLKTLIAWPRTHDYYQRNSWVGALKNDQGAWILDSPVSNATAHFLHNCWYILGDSPDSVPFPPV